jgi:hypothetical protein
LGWLTSVTRPQRPNILKKGSEDNIRIGALVAPPRNSRARPAVFAQGESTESL